MSTERRRHPRYEIAAQVPADHGRAGFGAQFVNPTVAAYDKLLELVATAARLSAEPPPLPHRGATGDLGEET